MQTLKALQRAFHAALDVLSAAGARLFELPVSFLLALSLLVFGLCVLLVRSGSSRFRAWLRGPKLLWLLLGYGALATVLLFDHKQQRIVRELRGLERELVGLRTDRSSLVTTGSASTSRELLLRNAVRSVLPEASVRVSAEAPGISYVSVTSEQPRLLVTHVARIDLEQPGLQIEITEALTVKRPLGEFAREHDCLVAINGEAGTMPVPNAELGEYAGNWIVRGKAVMLADTDKRPFLQFDRDNRGAYSPAARIDVKPSQDKHNVLWGRWDILVGGALVTWHDRRDAYVPRPRCAMGLDGKGRTLFLLTADGQQPGYSEGMSQLEVGSVLKALGATDAMACDEGGSAAMFLRSRKGLVSRPTGIAQGEKAERPTYTHFGVSLGRVPSRVPSARR